MSRSRRSAKQRRTSVLESLEAKREGGTTTYAAKLAAEPLGGTATVCTITHYCRTTVFKYPGCHMSTEDPVPQLVIAEDEAFRAAVVSDLPAYFQQDVFPHYAIDVSLRDAVDRVYRKVLSQSKSPNPPIFLVTEEYETIPATQFANGECFLIDEWRNGKALIEGGREGKRALLVFKTINPKPESKLRIASAKGRVKPLTRLLRYATALRVTAPLGCGSGVWYGRKVPFGPSTRPECPCLGCNAIERYQIRYKITG